MILETAIFAIRPGEAEQFLQTFASARRHIERSPGFIRLELRQGIEEPDTFILAVWWQTLEAHTVVFKTSTNFTAWRAEIGHLFARAPVVHHYADTQP